MNATVTPIERSLAAQLALRGACIPALELAEEMATELLGGPVSRPRVRRAREEFRKALTMARGAVG